MNFLFVHNSTMYKQTIIFFSDHLFLALYIKIYFSIFLAYFNFNMWKKSNIQFVVYYLNKLNGTCIYYENKNITNPLIILYFSPVAFPLSFFSISFPALAKFHNRSSVIYPSVYPLQKFKSSPEQDTKSIWSLSTRVSSAKKSNSSHSC